MYISVTALAVALAVPVAAGVATCVVGPIARSSRPEWAAVTELESLPADGTPLEFPIVITRSDAWCRLPDEVAGHVYLRRVETPTRVLALRATNYAGCRVDFNPDSRVFEDPCWNGRWDINGRRLHSTPEWGDLGPVGAVVRGDDVFVSLPDLRL
jgi:hypothetical protein